MNELDIFYDSNWTDDINDIDVSRYRDNVYSRYYNTIVVNYNKGAFNYNPDTTKNIIILNITHERYLYLTDKIAKMLSMKVEYIRQDIIRQ